LKQKLISVKVCKQKFLSVVRWPTTAMPKELTSQQKN